MPAGRPLKFATPEELQTKIDDYFESIREPRMIGESAYFEPATITGLAIHLGTYRDVLCDYQEKDEFSNTVKTAKLRVEHYAEKQLYMGKSAAGPIFALKNFGWSDKTEVDNTHKGDKENPIQHNVSGTVGILVGEQIERILGK